jgi:ferredoxin--NADP+ reductase
VALEGDGRVEAMVVERNQLESDGKGDVRAVATGERRHLPVGLVFRSVGYRGVPMAGVPFDERRGVIPNQLGRVTDAAGSEVPLAGLYVAGWIKRGPQGVIGTNKACAAETVAHLLADHGSGALPRVAGAPELLDELLASRGVRVTDWAAWQRLDTAEQQRGAPAGRPREKFVSVAEMLDVIGV